MSKALSNAEKALLKDKGIEVEEWLGSGASCDVYSVLPYHGQDGMCVKYIRDARKKDVEAEFERYRALYATEPGRFTRTADLIWIDVPDEEYPEKVSHCAAMVMEKLEKVNESTLTTQMIVKILFDCMVCLSYMHIIGIMHRDVKIDNVMYCVRTGTYVLLDYGVSAFGRDTFSENGCKGSPNEISPGALRGNYSRRDDYFSLGRMIRSLLVGKEIGYPSQEELKGESLFDYLYRKVADLKPLDENKFDDPDLIRIVNKLTEFDRDNRYRDHAELLGDLKKLIKDQNINVGRISRFPRNCYVVMVKEDSRGALSKERIRKAFHQYLARKRISNIAVCVVPFSETVYIRELRYGDDESTEIVLNGEGSEFLDKLRVRAEKAGARQSSMSESRIHACVVGAKPLLHGMLGLTAGLKRAFLSRRSTPLAYRIAVSDDYAFDVSELGIREIVPVDGDASFRRCLNRWFGEYGEAVA